MAVPSLGLGSITKSTSPQPNDSNQVGKDIHLRTYTTSPRTPTPRQDLMTSLSEIVKSPRLGINPTVDTGISNESCLRPGELIKDNPKLTKQPGSSNLRVMGGLPINKALPITLREALSLPRTQSAPMGSLSQQPEGLSVDLSTILHRSRSSPENKSAYPQNNLITVSLKSNLFSKPELTKELKVIIQELRDSDPNFEKATTEDIDDAVRSLIILELQKIDNSDKDEKAATILSLFSKRPDIFRILKNRVAILHNAVLNKGKANLIADLANSFRNFKEPADFNAYFTKISNKNLVILLELLHPDHKIALNVLNRICFMYSSDGLKWIERETYIINNELIEIAKIPENVFVWEWVKKGVPLDIISWGDVTRIFGVKFEESNIDKYTINGEVIPFTLSIPYSDDNKKMWTKQTATEYFQALFKAGFCAGELAAIIDVEEKAKFVSDLIDYQVYMFTECTPDRLINTLLLLYKNEFLDEIFSRCALEFEASSKKSILTKGEDSKQTLRRLFSVPSFLLSKLRPLNNFREIINNPDTLFSDLNSVYMKSKVFFDDPTEYLNILTLSSDIELFRNKEALKKIEATTLAHLERLEKLATWHQKYGVILDRVAFAMIDITLMTTATGGQRGENEFREAHTELKEKYQFFGYGERNLSLQIDEKGYRITHKFEYSNQPPEDRRAAKAQKPVEKQLQKNDSDPRLLKRKIFYTFPLFSTVFPLVENNVNLWQGKVITPELPVASDPTRSNLAMHHKICNAIRRATVKEKGFLISGNAGSSERVYG